MTAPRGTTARVMLQRGYVLFGIEWDRDIDATDLALHLWPLTVEWTWERVVRS